MSTSVVNDKTPARGALAAEEKEGPESTVKPCEQQTASRVVRETNNGRTERVNNLGGQTLIFIICHLSFFTGRWSSPPDGSKFRMVCIFCNLLLVK